MNIKTNGRHWPRVILVLGLLIHLVLVLRVYPPAFWAADDLLLRGDVARYYATTAAMAEIGGLYGYDPYNMAGYPVGLWNSMGKKGFEILHLLLPWLSLPRLFYLALVGASLLAPLLIWAAVRPFLDNRRQAGWLLALCVLYWHLSTQVAYFWGFGNVFFPTAAALLIAMTAAAHALLGGRRPALAALVLGGLAATVFYAHTVALLAGVAPLAVLLALHGRGAWRGPRLGWLLLATGIFLALCLPWLIPLLQNRADCLSQPKAWFQAGPKTLVMDLFSDRVYRQPFDRNFLYRTAVVLGLFGMGLAGRRQPLVTALGAGGVGALLIAYGGSYFPATQSVQPYRFVIPATLLFLAPAALALEAGWSRWRAAEPPARRGVAVLLILLLPGFTAYLIDLAWPRDPIGITDAQRAVIAHLQTHPPSGRVFVDDADLGHLLPSRARVSVIGGLSTQAFVHHRYAGVDEEHIAFGRHARDWTEAEFRIYLETYAVELAILTSRPWQNAAARMPGLFRRTATVGGSPFYQVVDAQPSLVLEGAARVEADYAGIHVREAQPGPLVLKLHYAPWLKTDLGIPVIPVPVGDDPVPFIRVDVPPGSPDFTIFKPHRSSRTP